MWIRCEFDVNSMWIRCEFNVNSMVIQRLFNGKSVVMYCVCNVNAMWIQWKSMWIQWKWRNRWKLMECWNDGIQGQLKEIDGYWWKSMKIQWKLSEFNGIDMNSMECGITSNYRLGRLADRHGGTPWAADSWHMTPRSMHHDSMTQHSMTQHSMTH